MYPLILAIYPLILNSLSIPTKTHIPIYPLILNRQTPEAPKHPLIMDSPAS